MSIATVAGLGSNRGAGACFLRLLIHRQLSDGAAELALPAGGRDCIGTLSVEPGATSRLETQAAG